MQKSSPVQPQTPHPFNTIGGYFGVTGEHQSYELKTINPLGRLATILFRRHPVEETSLVDAASNVLSNLPTTLETPQPPSNKSHRNRLRRIGRYPAAITVATVGLLAIGVANPEHSGTQKVLTEQSYDDDTQSLPTVELGTSLDLKRTPATKDEIKMAQSALQKSRVDKQESTKIELLEEKIDSIAHLLPTEYSPGVKMGDIIFHSKNPAADGNTIAYDWRSDDPRDPELARTEDTVLESGHASGLFSANYSPQVVGYPGVAPHAGATAHFSSAGGPFHNLPSLSKGDTVELTNIPGADGVSLIFTVVEGAQVVDPHVNPVDNNAIRYGNYYSPATDQVIEPKQNTGFDRQFTLTTCTPNVRAGIDLTQYAVRTHLTDVVYTNDDGQQSPSRTINSK